MIFNSDAIVLKTVKTGESDRLLTLLTRERGVMRAFAKAADRPKNKLHMSTDMFCYGSFKFFEGTQSVRAEECDLIETFFSLRNDIKTLALAQYFSELTMESAPKNEPADDCLRLILNSLYFLENGEKDRRILKPVFELRLMSSAGYMPSLVACAQCGCFETDKMYFSEQTGELFCENCRKTGASEYPLEVITAMRHIVFSRLESLFTLKVSEENILLLTKACEKYTLNITQKKFTTLDFYNSV